MILTACELRLEFLQIENPVHKFLLGVLDPVQGCEILAIKVGAVFFLAKGRPGFEHFNHGAHDRVGLLGHSGGMTRSRLDGFPRIVVEILLGRPSSDCVSIHVICVTSTDD